MLSCICFFFPFTKSYLNSVSSVIREIRVARAPAMDYIDWHRNRINKLQLVVIGQLDEALPNFFVHPHFVSNNLRYKFTVLL